VRDYLEQVGDAARSEVRLSLEGARGTVEDGAELRFRVESDRGGFLSLFVVDADGSVGMLVPNEGVRELPIRPRTAVSVPSDLGFRLLARPPYGATRIKAIVTKAPLPLAGSANAGQALRRVQLGETVGGTEPNVRPDWASAEIEFLVVPKGRAAPPAAPAAPAAPEPAAAAPARAPTLRVAEGLPLLFGAAEALNIDDSLLTDSTCALLRWPLKSPFDAGIDIGWREPAPGAAPCSVRVGVVDADFDPDDPYLARSFASITTDVREAMRAEIRRNGRAPFRHGNRVISIIGGEAPWLPGVLPGIPIVPIRITTTVDAPAYRAPRGGADELLLALRRALAAGCRVVNLSLSVPLDADSLKTFQADPVWDELERAGVVVVCAAGNANENLDEHPSYPACLDRPNIVCVGAVGPDGTLSRWDGQGSARGSRSVDLVAPGTWVVVSDGGGGSSLACGTSYACAFVTGAAARLIELNPGISPGDVVARLVAGSRPLPALAGKARGGLLQWPSQAP
jgi:subtilisin family serine protease